MSTDSRDNDSAPGKTFPGAQRFFTAVGFGVLIGGGASQVIGGGVLIAISTGLIAAGTYMREAIRGGSSPRELAVVITLAVLAIAGIRAYQVISSDELEPVALGQPLILGVGAAPNALATSSHGVWVGSSRGILSRVSGGAIVRVLVLPRGLRDVAAGHGAVWAVRAGELIKIDSGNSKLRSRRTYGLQIGEVALSSDGVWLTLPVEDEVLLVPPDLGRPLVTVRVAHPLAIALSEDYLYVARNSVHGDFALLLRFTLSGKPAGRYRLPPNPRDLVANGRWLWISHYGLGELTRFDTATEEQHAIDLGGTSPSGIAVGDGRIWVTDEEQDSLSQVDPSRGETVARMPAGEEPRDVVIWRSSLFVASGLDGTVKIFPTISPGGAAQVPQLTLGDRFCDGIGPQYPY